MAVTLIGGAVFPSFAYWPTPNIRARVIVLRVILDLGNPLSKLLELLRERGAYYLS